jgi:plastocyanin
MKEGAMTLKHALIGTLTAGGLFFLLNACNQPTPTVTACPAIIETQTADQAKNLPNAYLPSSCTIKLSGPSKFVTIKAVSFVHPFSTISTNWPGGPVSARNNDYSATFTTAGTYTYACAQHPEMTGTITVEN